MTRIEKLRKDRKISLKKLDDAMDKCAQEHDKMIDKVKNSKSKFLSSYKDYKNHKISDKEFLQITGNFAQIIDLEEKMYNKFSKILGPLDREFQKRCKKIFEWENHSSKDKMCGDVT